MKNLKKKLRADWVRNRSLYALVIPVVAFIFCLTTSLFMAQSLHFRIIHQGLVFPAANGWGLIILRDFSRISILGG